MVDIVRALGIMGSCFSGESPTSVPTRNASVKKDDDMSDSMEQMVLKMNDSNKLEMRLHRVPGRFILNASTDCASLFTKQGKKGINQDAMILWENFGSKEDATFCGVFDGHGPNGHMVAKKVKGSLPLKLRAQWELNIGLQELCNMNNSSGIGDSRAVLGTRDKDDSPIAVQLTEDHKPSLPREAERIRLCKGRVFALPSEPEIARVWLPKLNFVILSFFFFFFIL